MDYYLGNTFFHTYYNIGGEKEKKQAGKKRFCIIYRIIKFNHLSIKSRNILSGFGVY